MQTAPFGQLCKRLLCVIAPLFCCHVGITEFNRSGVAKLLQRVEEIIPSCSNFKKFRRSFTFHFYLQILLRWKTLLSQPISKGTESAALLQKASKGVDLSPLPCSLPIATRKEAHKTRVSVCFCVSTESLFLGVKPGESKLNACLCVLHRQHYKHKNFIIAPWRFS